MYICMYSPLCQFSIIYKVMSVHIFYWIMKNIIISKPYTTLPFTSVSRARNKGVPGAKASLELSCGILKFLQGAQICVLFDIHNTFMKLMKM